ncbi:MAG TPA: potassium channel family protein [Candidatus Acidoferrales bacterium]|nr:potassium channel family protein [Candidatus Acidoferrales bacterium]
MSFDWLWVALGGVLVLWVLNDVFQSVIVPRAVGNRYRLSFNLRRLMWYAWPKVALQLYAGDDDRREDFLAIFAPFALTAAVLSWAGMLIVGYGVIFYGLRSGLAPPVRSLGAATYFAGTTLTTIGFGDFVGRNAATRFFSVCAAVNGLVLFSVTTAYLFALFGSFQTREAFVVGIGARAGAPPSGVGLLAIAGHSQTVDGLPALFFDAQLWTAMLMETHLAYPILGYFRSSHDYQSWVGTLGTLLDAATLLMTAIDGVPSGQARILYNVGRHAALDLSKYYRASVAGGAPLVERSEFDHACERLANAGYTVRDRTLAWQRFSELRATYAPHLNAIASLFLIPPLQWIGDRSELAGKAH